MMYIPVCNQVAIVYRDMQLKLAEGAKTTLPKNNRLFLKNLLGYPRAKEDFEFRWLHFGFSWLFCLGNYDFANIFLLAWGIL